MVINHLFKRKKKNTENPYSEQRNTEKHIIGLAEIQIQYVGPRKTMCREGKCRRNTQESPRGIWPGLLIAGVERGVFSGRRAEHFEQR